MLYVAGAPLTAEETMVVVGLVALLVWAARAIFRRDGGPKEKEDRGK